MKLVSQSEFARIGGLSRQAVYDAIKRDAIKITVDETGKKKIDLDIKKNSDYLKDFSNGQRKKKPDIKIEKKRENKKQNKKTSEQVPEKTGKKKQQENKIIAAEDPFEDTDETGSIGKYLLQCKKLEADIKRIDVITREKRQDLIDRELVAIVFSKMHSIDTTELLQLPAKVSPEITAAAGVDDPTIQIKIEKLLENELYKILERCKSLLNKELKKLNTEIKEMTA